MFADSEGIASSGLPEIANSLRFNAANSTYAVRTQGTPTDSRRCVLSVFAKRGQLGRIQGIFGCYPSAGASNSNNLMLEYNSSDNLQLGGFSTNWRITNQLFRDPSAWDHYIVSLDSTVANTVLILKNGQQITSFSTSNDVSANFAWPWNISGAIVMFGQEGQALASGRYLDGYLANAVFLDGKSIQNSDVTAASFAYTDPNNQWRSLSKAALTTLASSGGTNSFFLPFDNTTSTTTLGYDASSKGNNFTLTNMVRDGSVNDASVIDTPTNNWATWSAIGNSPNASTSGGGLDFVSTGGSSVYGTITATVVPTTKVYWEVPFVSSGWFAKFGMCRSPENLVSSGSSSLGETTTLPYSLGYNNQNGNLHYNGSVLATYATPTTGDIIMMCYDPATHYLWLGRNGTWYNSGNPAAGTGYVATLNTSYDYVPALSLGNSATWQGTCFGQRPVSGGAFDSASGGYFRYTPPSGFKALCRKNLPDPAIPVPNKHFDVSTFIANASVQSITGLNFQPDFVWTKSRANAYRNNLYDAVRGVNNILQSDQTAAELAAPNTLTSFNSNGFTLGSQDNANYTNATGSVAWSWNMGGSTVTNNAGSISSQVRANALAGMSVVTIASGNSGTATIGHGLPSAPGLIIGKCRNATTDWPVYHKNLTSGYSLFLDITNAQTSGSWFPATAPTSTVFTVGYPGNSSQNESGRPYVFYCFTEIPGFSKIGSYTGNGSTDGWMVVCGFKPRFIMMKRTDTTSNWTTYDSARDTYNAAQTIISPNTSSAEYNGTDVQIDLLSNGFKLRTTNADRNASGGTYVFIALAQNPFKYSNAN